VETPYFLLSDPFYGTLKLMVIPLIIHACVRGYTTSDMPPLKTVRDMMSRLIRTNAMNYLLLCSRVLLVEGVCSFVR